MEGQGQRKCFVKLVVIGESGVGKSSLIHYFQKGFFYESFKPTIGADFANREVKLNDRTVVLQIWDTAGQERFQSLSNAFYRGADCCVIVYDVTDRASFDQIEKWKDHFIDKSQPDDVNKVPILIVGNKTDLESERAVTTEQGRDYCKEYSN